MYYLTDPHRNTLSQLQVLAQSNNNTFPHQVDCNGHSIPRTGKLSTGFLQVVCVQSGHSKPCEVFRDVAMKNFTTEFKTSKKKKVNNGK